MTSSPNRASAVEHRLVRRPAGLAEAQRHVVGAGRLGPGRGLGADLVARPHQEAPGRHPVEGEAVAVDRRAPRLEAGPVGADVPVEAVDGQRVGPPVPRGLGPVARDPGLAEEGDPRRGAVGGAPRPVALGQARDRRHVALGVGEPAVGAAGRAVEARGRVGADPDLGARQGERPRRDADRLHRADGGPRRRRARPRRPRRGRPAPRRAPRRGGRGARRRRRSPPPGGRCPGPAPAARA